MSIKPSVFSHCPKVYQLTARALWTLQIQTLQHPSCVAKGPCIESAPGATEGQSPASYQNWEQATEGRNAPEERTEHTYPIAPVRPVLTVEESSSSVQLGT